MNQQLNRDFALVSWREVSRTGSFVFCRRGTGETGWWHQHADDPDYGGNPADGNSRPGQHERIYKCRTCGELLVVPNAVLVNEGTLNSEKNSGADKDVLAVKFGTRWIVQKTVNQFYDTPENIAICRTSDLAFSVMRAQPDYGRFGVSYDCHEMDNFE